MNTITFTIRIDAPRDRVWRAMLDPESYRIWTTPFMEGSHYTGVMAPGERINFLGPNGEGMLSEVAEFAEHEFISFRHIGIVKDGVVDTESELARAMTPAFENYTFKDVGQGTEVFVESEIGAEYEEMMRMIWPQALAVLKEICESPAK